MPIRNNRNIRKVKPHIVRNLKKNVIKNKPNSTPSPTPTSSNDKKYGETKSIWQDEVVYIVGGGPSLKDFDWTKLKGKKVIAINRAFEVVPDADVLYWTDSRFFRWFKEDIKKFTGLKYTCRPFIGKPADVTLLQSNSAMKLEMRPSFISHGNNSGYGAINLAVKLGATKIYLLGYDMNSNPKDTHWHSGYDTKHNHSIYSKMIKYFEGLPAEAEKLGVEIFNANIKSQLTVFRKCTIEDAINDRAYNPFRNT